MQRYRRLLYAKRDELLAARRKDAAPAPAAGHTPGDVVDQATEDAEASVRVRIRQTESLLLRAIEEALTRIEQGVYGVCPACQQPIPDVRLDSVPWTRLCRQCKEQQGS